MQARSAPPPAPKAAMHASSIRTVRLDGLRMGLQYAKVSMG
ncbi:MAG TPA: hypothetical protein VIJ22_00825 [Polyangiaceae bacterium]